MGQFVGRLVAVLTLLFAASYLLQVDDSLASSVPAPLPKASLNLTPILVAQGETASREYFIKHQDIVPLGAAAIRLPILMYHYVRTPPSTRTDLLGYRLSVAPEVFQTQMDWLFYNQYHAVNFNDVRAYFAGIRPLPPKPFMITLDDGYTDLYTTAYPILRSHRFTAVAYIVTSFVGTSRYVSREQVVEMDHAGIQIASHTVNHADLARSSFGSQMYQLLESKRWLEHLLGHPVVDFAYPSGQFNSQVMTAVRQAGYDTAVTEQVSIVHSPADRYAWARVRVGGGEGMPEFVASLGDSMPTVTISNIEVMPGRVFRERPTRPYL
jgi:peptidoglycan/xylan/chitin deacetylase (PgdA/CDA1 family)